MSTIQEMREVCQVRKRNAKGQMVLAGYWFNALFSRRFSIYLTWAFVKMGVSANGVTFLMIPTGMIGVALYAPHILWANLAGMFLLLLAVVLDCVDGEVARWTKTSSIRGAYLDLVYHSLCLPLLSVICPLHLYVWKGEVKYLALAFAAYAISHTMLSTRYAFVIVKSQAAEGSASDTSAPDETVQPRKRSLVTGAGHLIRKVWGRTSDQVVIQMVSAIVIIMSYAGITAPVVLVSWLMPIIGVTRVVGTIVGRYFWRVPAVGHVKKW